MAGDDEARARLVLIEMQGRIIKGPQVALGVDSSASGEQIHSAFLQLTKRFHPARFGRMSNEVQRLSNEVFLGIKSAHDVLLRSVGAPPRGATAKSSQTMPVLHAEGSNRTTSKIPTAQSPPLRADRAAGTGQTPAVPRTLTPSRITPPRDGGPVISRTLTPGRVMPPPAARQPTPAFGIRTVRQGTPPERPATPPSVRAGTPPNARHPTPPQGSQPLPQQQQKTAPVFDDRSELQRALDLINARDWAGARTVLHGLIARTPSKQYRALVCYTRGREAHAEGKGEEAKMEYDRALHLDPNLDRAATALRELMRRR